MAEYYMLLTDAGHAAYAQAGAAHGPVQISAVAVGDGGGVAVQPAESWTALVHEVWRSAPALVQVVADNPRLVLVEANVPNDVGGWYVREIGLFSPEGVLLAVGNHPESYKPALDSGAGKELMLRLYIEHSNAKETTLKINPDIVMASCSYVLNAVTTHDASPTAHAGQLAGMSDHVADKANPHQVTAAQAGAEPAGAVAAHDISPTAHAGQFAGVAEHIADLANPHQVTAAQAGAEPLGSVAGHNESGTAHADIRAAIAGIVIPTATEAEAGVIKQATAAQALAGTDNTTAMSPADVAAVLAAVGRLPRCVYLTASGNWAVPAGVTEIIAEVWGGGGGGGTVTTNSSSGGGGGGGYARKRIAVSPGQVIPVTIGAGGPGGTSSSVHGAAGGTSSVGAHCSATGGGGGNSGTGQTIVSGGVGGTGVGGDVNVAGESGGVGTDTSYLDLIGQGGASYGHPGGPLRATNGYTGSAYPGIAGANPGCGGSGSGDTASHGGAGRAGQAIIWY